MTNARSPGMKDAHKTKRDPLPGRMTRSPFVESRIEKLPWTGLNSDLCKNEGVVTFDTLAHEKRSAIAQLADKYGARNLHVFGSVARGDNSETSDVDLLAEFGKDRTLFDLIAFRLDLRDLLGVDVDIVTPGTLRYIRDNVLAEARPI